MNVLAAVKTAYTFAKQHRKGIAMVSGALLTTGAVAYAVVESPKAKEAMDAVKPENGMTNKELYILKAKSVVPYMWPVALLTVGGIGCFFYANHVSVKEIKEAVKEGVMWKQMYNEATKMHNDYVNANRKIAGEEIHRQVATEAAQEQVKRHNGSYPIANTGCGDTLYYIAKTNIFFRSSPTHIMNAVNSYYKDMTKGRLPNSLSDGDYFGTENELLVDYFNIPSNSVPKYTNEVGWYPEGRCEFGIEITNSFIDDPNGNPAQIIEYKNDPSEPWHNWY